MHSYTTVRHVCLLVMRVSSAKQPYRSKCCLGCVTAEPNKPLLGWSQILPWKGALLGVILGHEQTCPRLICSTLLARRQEQCSFWQPVYRSNWLYYTANVRFHAFTAHLWAVHVCVRACVHACLSSDILFSAEHCWIDETSIWPVKTYASYPQGSLLKRLKEEN